MAEPYVDSFDGISLTRRAFGRRPILLLFVVTFLIHWCFRYLQKAQQRREEDKFGAAHGCQPVAKIPYKWPLSIDLVRKSLKANANQQLLSAYTEYFDTLGPNLEMTLLGGVSYVTIDPANVEYILSNSQDFCFGSRRGAFLRLLGEGVFTQDGSDWKHSREVLRHQFMRMQYKNLTGFNEHVEKLVKCIGSAGNIVDLQPLFFQFTLDVTTALIFGKSVNSLDGQEGQPFADCFDKACFMTAIRARLADGYWMYTTPAFIKACDDVKRYAEGYIRKSLDSTTKDDTKTMSSNTEFVKILFDEFKDVNMVRDQLINLLLAGRDTTASLLSWTFFLLVRHPEAFQRLKDEITTLPKHDLPITRSDIQKLSYLDCVLKETLRLYPPVAVNVRSAVKSTVLPRGGGPDGKSPILVRAGMGIGWSSYHMHRRKDLYGQDADQFRPERWQGQESRLNDVGWGYIPFNGGPRICLGKDFALMEASLAVIRIIQAFPELKLPRGADVVSTGQEKQVLTLTLSSAAGCVVQLKHDGDA